MDITEKIVAFVPCSIISEANNTDHWTKKYKRKKNIHWAVNAALLNTYQSFPIPATITLQRIGKKTLDFDNLVHAFKAVKDIIAKIIIDQVDSNIQKPIGLYDADPRLSWQYTQTTQSKNSKINTQIGFYITIENVKK